jgi:hypothetical protein
MDATDVEAVTEAIRGAALCTICIVRKTGVAPIGVAGALAVIGQQVEIEAVARCQGCLQMSSTHRRTDGRRG